MRILRARLLAAAQEEAERRRRPSGARARSAPSTGPSGSAPTTSRRTGSPTTESSTSPTTSTHVLDGDLDPMIQALMDADIAHRLAGQALTRGDDNGAAGRRGGPLDGAGGSGRAVAPLRCRGAGGPCARRLSRRHRPSRDPRCRGLRRPGGSPGAARAPATPDRPGRVPSHRGGRGARGLRPAPRDRGDDRGRHRGRPHARPAAGGRPLRRLGRDRARRRRRGSRCRGPRGRGRGRCDRLAAAQLAGTRVVAHHADVERCLLELTGTVDVVVANPPYVPLGAEVRDPEVAMHDPAVALWSGPDGLDAMRVLERTAARLLRPGGYLFAEHADVQGLSAPALFADSGPLGGRVRPGRPRRSSALPFRPPRRPLTGSWRCSRGTKRHRGPRLLAVSNTYDCHDPDQRRRGIAAAVRAVRRGHAGRDAHRHGLRARLRRVQPRGGRGSVGRQGTRPRCAGADSGRVGIDAQRRLRANRWRGQRPGGGVLAGRADARLPSAAVVALGPRRRRRHGRRPDAAAPGRDRGASRDRPDGREQRQPIGATAGAVGASRHATNSGM